MEKVKSEYSKKVMSICKYSLFFVLFYILSQANINNLIYPFAFGAFYALVWTNQKVYVLSPLYVLSQVLSNFSLESVIISCSTVLFLLLTYMIHYKFKKPLKPFLMVFYALLSQTAFVWLNIVAGVSPLIVLASVIIGLLFLASCMNFFTAVFVRGITNRLKVVEMISGSIFVMAFASGLNSFWLFEFEIVKFVALFVILISAYCFDIRFSLVLAGVFGIGTILNNSNAVYVAPFIIWALTINTFKIKNRIIPVLALLAVEAALGFYFELYYSYSYLSFASVALAGALFLSIPQKVLSDLNAIFSSSSQNLAMRNIVNRNRDGLSRRFNNLAEVFGEMDRVFRSMIKGGLTIDDAKDLLKTEVKEKFAVYQKDNKIKLRGYDKELDNVLLELIIIALERNHITLLDIPPFLTSQYSNINALVSIINNTTQQYKQYASFLNNLDASKVLIAEQLTGVSKIMRNLSNEVGKNVMFDNVKEDKIVNELTYNNIICSEAIIYEQNPSILNVSLVVKKEDSAKAKIPKIISKILGYPMVVSDVSPAERGGWNIIELKNSPQFDIIFGTAGCSKIADNVSGDVYSLIRLENDKFMMALCDGMGNGKQAENSSSLAVGLLENFYKAGFDNDIILSSVNNLLSIGSHDETFSALDICVLDLKNGISDFVKLGATNGYVRHIDGITKIKCESLPIGIVRQLKPIVEKVVLSAGDIVFLFTDGVTDSFDTETDMEDFLKSITTVNPQTIADEVLKRAIENYNGIPKDDMTVLVARIYER